MNTSIGIISLGRLGSALARGLDRAGHTGGRSEAGVVHLRATLPAVYEAMLQKMRAW